MVCLSFITAWVELLPPPTGEGTKPPLFDVGLSCVTAFAGGLDRQSPVLGSPEITGKVCRTPHNINTPPPPLSAALFIYCWPATIVLEEKN